ncbi:MAG: GNAT family N-acetyltransferase, partial [Pseudomonadota bacterium]
GMPATPTAHAGTAGGGTPPGPRRVAVRRAVPADIPAILRLSDRRRAGQPALTGGQIRGQLSAFPDGQFVATEEGAVVGYAAACRAPAALALGDHTWQAVTGDGHAARHDPDGPWLYGIAVLTDRAHARRGLGQRLSQAHKRLCRKRGLAGIAFGARVPGFARRSAPYPTAEAYLQALAAGTVREPGLAAALRAGFVPTRALPGYRPGADASGGHAALMVWHNPDGQADTGAEPGAGPTADGGADPAPQTARVTTVQMQVRAFASPDAFFRTVERFVATAASYASDFVVFPELFTLSLLTAEGRRLPAAEAMAAMTTHTEPFVARLKAWATGYKINIVGGSHPTRTVSGDIRNIAYVALRDGTVHAQEKLHPTPDERQCWGVTGGDRIDAIQTDCGPIGVLICYDSEFPELARRLVDQGARMLFVPYCTDTRHGHLRVKYCCQARAVENQAYVVTAGTVGTLPDVENMDIQYAQSAIYTPCDFPFARDGIAAETSENVEMVAVADLDLATLGRARAQGSVRNLGDRRFDLYRVAWTEAD